MRPQRTFPTAQHELFCPLHMPLLRHMCMIAVFHQPAVFSLLLIVYGWSKTAQSLPETWQTATLD